MSEELPSSALYFNGKLIWYNPAGLGHFGIKLRKSLWEDELCRRMDIRFIIKRLMVHKLAQQIHTIINLPRK